MKQESTRACPVECQLPEEMQLRKEIFNLEELIASAQLDPEKRETAKAKLFDKIMRYKMITEKKRR